MRPATLLQFDARSAAQHPKDEQVVAASAALPIEQALFDAVALVQAIAPSCPGFEAAVDRWLTVLGVSREEAAKINAMFAEG